MEKRERRERPRKQRQEAGGRNDPPNINNNHNNNSYRDKNVRDDRDNNVRDNRDNKDKDKTSSAPKVEEKKVIDHTAIPDPHMFDNLKRETDDIAALTAKKHTKRQIFSNWSRYETLPDDEEENQKIGEDYETLLRGAQSGSHFQLRSERCWDPKSLPAQSAAFTIDLGVLAASLACLPLHEKLNLPVELFSTEELEHMDRNARYGRETLSQHLKRRGKSVEKEGLAIDGLLQDKFMDRAPSAEPHLLPSIPPMQQADYSAAMDESDEFNFGTLPPPTKDLTSAVQKKEKTPPIKEPEPRATPPRDVAVERSLTPKQEVSTPVEIECEDFSSVESNPLPPRGVAKRQPGVEPVVKPAVKLAVEPLVEPQTSKEIHEVPRKEVTSEEISPIQEAVGKKKSKGGKSKTNKHRSLVYDLESSDQPPPTHQPHQPLSSNNENVPTTKEANESVTIVQQSLKEMENVVPHAETIRSEQPKTNKKKRVSKELAVEESVKTDLSSTYKENVQSMEKVKSSKGNAMASNSTTTSQPLLKSETKKPVENIQQVTPKKDDELDELLSLRKPVSAQQVLNFAVPTSAVKASIDEDDISSISKPVIAEKKEDLEDWLDSMLDD